MGFLKKYGFFEKDGLFLIWKNPGFFKPIRGQEKTLGFLTNQRAGKKYGFFEKVWVF